MKNLFRLTALATMVSMMATATVATSCSDDDDDETPVVLVKDTTFTVNMGGSGSTAGSFLSVKDGKVYKKSDVAAHGDNVEIVFTGYTFVSADKSENSIVNSNNQSATISQTSPLTFSYETSTGYKGSLTLVEEPGDAGANYVVTVIRQIK